MQKGPVKKVKKKTKNSTAGIKASTLNWRLPRLAIISAESVDPTPHGAPFHVSTTSYGPETETEARVHGLTPSPINYGLTEPKKKEKKTSCPHPGTTSLIPMRRYGAYQSYILQPAFHAHHFSLILTPLSSSPPDTCRMYKDGFGEPYLI